MSNVGKVSLVRVTLPAAVCLAILTACAPPETAPALKEGKMKITSPAFQEGAAIPSRYSCDGEDISPALSWSGAPEGTRYFALVMDDPDAPGGIFTHWIIFNIPADSRGLAEAVATEPQLASGARQGRNDFGKLGYGGPCPPRGALHRYHFTLYALDQPLNLTAGVTRKQALDAMRGHTLAQTELIGTFQR
ncbi:MAG: YbhB/YbcL family Raf kinase inhibitor-like protein [Dehalococcoidales bacterium]|nr:YbhB/YbcL family Raf kinase inhibitor-like protein [Dehalococcoidales bacterium]